jgi:hypothetical protein
VPFESKKRASATLTCKRTWLQQEPVTMMIYRARIFMTSHIFYLTSFSMPKLISTRF